MVKLKRTGPAEGPGLMQNAGRAAKTAERAVVATLFWNGGACIRTPYKGVEEGGKGRISAKRW
jgi:hypothetical protein